MFTEVSRIPYSNIHGVLEAIQPLEKVAIKTNVGSLVPVYKVEDQGRMKLTPVKVDSFGKIKSLQLQTPTIIPTCVGYISAEFVTFYPSGNIRRLFPLNGKLSGYWSEENEYSLAKDISIPTPIGIINVKPIYVHFYETGELKSITFWPKEIVEVKTPKGQFSIKTGISFFQNGQLRSLEPAAPVTIETPIGNIEAFDADPMGINGEKNSLSFYEDGSVANISTMNIQIEITNPLGEKYTYTPGIQASRCNDEVFVIIPLKLEFKDGYIIFRHGFKTIGNVSLNWEIKLIDYTNENQLEGVSSCH